jgi:protein-S-isoprenylcysteine O-methyltransferase Ste14
MEPAYRLAFSALFVGALLMSGVYRSRARRASGTIPRVREGRAALAARMLAASVLAVGPVDFALDLRWLEWARISVPDWLRWAGAALGLASLLWLRQTFRAIGSNISETVLTKPRHRLVTHGTYRWIRHPLYAGSLVLLAGLGLLAASGWMLLSTILALAAIRVFVVPREEAELASRFGPAYREYRDRTGAMLPLRRARPGRPRAQPPHPQPQTDGAAHDA